MFIQEDARVFELPDSHNKIDAIGEVYFPKLGALLVKANALIFDIYGIQPNNRYKVSQAPTPPKNRRKDAEFKINRNHTNQATVGLRAKGEPKNLVKPDGTRCQMHFASLAFGIVQSDSGVELGVGFDPYILKYHQKHRDDFASWIEILDLSMTLENIPLYLSHDVKSLSDLMRIHRAMLLGNFTSAINPTITSIADLVITFAAMFPLLDVFTRLSDSEDVADSDYAERFCDWYDSKRDDYINTFSIEPLQHEPTKLSESQVRSYFESLLSRKFPTARPSWLKSNRQTNLELDGYCEELKVAFEYQGEYHYFYVPIHHQERSLEEVQEIDTLKKQLCEKHGVSLIQVPYWERDNINFIIERLRALNMPDINDILSRTDVR